MLMLTRDSRWGAQWGGLQVTQDAPDQGGLNDDDLPSVKRQNRDNEFNCISMRGGMAVSDTLKKCRIGAITQNLHSAVHPTPLRSTMRSPRSRKTGAQLAEQWR